MSFLSQFKADDGGQPKRSAQPAPKRSDAPTCERCGASEGAQFSLGSPHGFGRYCVACDAEVTRSDARIAADPTPSEGLQVAEERVREIVANTRAAARDAFASEFGASPGSPNYETRGSEFDELDARIVDTRREEDPPPAAVVQDAADLPASLPKWSEWSPDGYGPQAAEIPSDARITEGLAAAFAPEAPDPDAKRSAHYMRIGTEALRIIGLEGGIGSLAAGRGPDRVGVLGELAWRHKPAAHKAAAQLGGVAGTRAYEGARA